MAPIREYGEIAGQIFVRICFNSIGAKTGPCWR